MCDSFERRAREEARRHLYEAPLDLTETKLLNFVKGAEWGKGDAMEDQALKRRLWITRGILLVLMAISLGQTVVLLRWRRWALDCWRTQAACPGCGTVIIVPVPDAVGVCVANCGTAPLASRAGANPALVPSPGALWPFETVRPGSHRPNERQNKTQSAAAVAIVKFISSANEWRLRCAFDNQPIRGHAVQESAKIPGRVHDAEVNFELEMLRGEWHVGNGLKVVGAVE